MVRRIMDAADGWFICRIGFVETVRAVGVTAGQAVREEWATFGVVEVDQALTERAAELIAKGDLRSPNALHLAAAVAPPPDVLVLATWDCRLSECARE